MRTLLLGAFGLVLAVATGLGVHLVTRETIALPVVKLEQGAALAPAAAARAATDGARTTVRPTVRRTTIRSTTAGRRTAATTDDSSRTTDGSGSASNSGSGSDSSGRGRGRGRGGDESDD